MRIINATYEIPGMTKEEAERFLESKLNLQIATIDEKGEPNIQPVWFYYDKGQGKLLITTSKLAKKTQNLRRKPTVYFSIDDENYGENLPPKGVKGKGIATIVEEDPKNGEIVLVEISPKFFSTWDYGKMQVL